MARQLKTGLTLSAEARRHFDVRGFEELERKLLAMGNVVTVRALRSVLLECAQSIRDAALGHVRRLYKKHSGNLEKSLIARLGKSETRASAWVKSAAGIAPHAHLLEFGHRIVGHKPKLRDTGKTAQAKPFFRPAVDERKAAIRQKVADFIRDLLVKA